MARDYDSQLLESTAVRRKRLREAVFFGPQRSRRRLDENLGKVVISVCVSAAVCAGTVGWSFVQTQLDGRDQQEQQASPEATSAPLPADWVGSEVTFPMLREELGHARVPPDLYVLPGDERPSPEEVSSYYLVTEEGADGYSAGIIEFDQGRTGPEFATEDEACRWLYQELASAVSDPQPLGADEEREADELTSELTSTVRDRLDGRAGGVQVTLERGQVVDALGQESGSVLFPDRTPLARRDLPEAVRGAEGSALRESYHRYRVAFPFQVEASAVAAREGGPDGVRFDVGAQGFAQPPELPSIRWLVGNGYLERVAATDLPS
ncbi:uncharacterized protein DUF4237 [Haloactinospora alba]|uniref:Uncharacterized protein DUF4237 n=1 Tax=Haloactinospora alba TaxID=405555 RepID=A0A543NEC6_9ACTN|nr:TNT domain-containing protein [Haloactinospora alba]TQN30183.1 uncharacterized protein DUF4237 [Haloactinospora alba]